MIFSFVAVPSLSSVWLFDLRTFRDRTKKELGVVIRERIKPFFLQKTCIIPLSGFFASLFWLFII